MIIFPDDIKDLLRRGGEEIFYAARIWHRGSFINVWTGCTLNNNVTLEEVTYTGPSTIVAVDSINVVSSVDRSLFSITLSDSSLMAGDRSYTGLVGKLLEVRLGFIDPDTGNPLISSFVAYRGLIDSVQLEITTSTEGEEMLKIGAASPMNDLGMKRSIYLSKEETRRRDPSDSSCDEITKGSVGKGLRWGKTIPKKEGS